MGEADPSRHDLDHTGRLADRQCVHGATGQAQQRADRLPCRSRHRQDGQHLAGVERETFDTRREHHVQPGSEGQWVGQGIGPGQLIGRQPGHQRAQRQWVPLCSGEQVARDEGSQHRGGCRCSDDLGRVVVGQPVERHDDGKVETVEVAGREHERGRDAGQPSGEEHQCACRLPVEPVEVVDDDQQRRRSCFRDQGEQCHVHRMRGCASLSGARGVGQHVSVLRCEIADISAESLHQLAESGPGEFLLAPHTLDPDHPDVSGVRLFDEFGQECALAHAGVGPQDDGRPGPVECGLQAVPDALALSRSADDHQTGNAIPCNRWTWGSPGRDAPAVVLRRRVAGPVRSQRRPTAQPGSSRRAFDRWPRGGSRSCGG